MNTNKQGDFKEKAFHIHKTNKTQWELSKEKVQLVPKKMLIIGFLRVSIDHIFIPI
jgi:hypothetical protein